MPLTELHKSLLSRAFSEVLGAAETGAMAFVRCLTGDILEELAAAPDFRPAGWKVWRVADADDAGSRTLTADRAVELREAKDNAVLLLVDTNRAGAGMDGIYSAVREVREEDLFEKAISLAAHELTAALSRKHREFAERAIRKARSRGRRAVVSPWNQFDFLVQSAQARRHHGELLYLIGLWPLKQGEGVDDWSGLDVSRMFVDRLFLTASRGALPAARIAALNLKDPSKEQLHDLEAFLRKAALMPLMEALTELQSKPHLWVNALRVQGPEEDIQDIEIVSWRNPAGKLHAWSGLTGGDDDKPPELILSKEITDRKKQPQLTVKWKVRPGTHEKGAAEYRVAVVSDLGEELAAREVSHSGKNEEKIKFTQHDFMDLSEDTLISATAVVSVNGKDAIEPKQTEEFIICFGNPPDRNKAGGGTEVRCFSEGLIELDERELITEIAGSSAVLSEDKKGYVLLRVPRKQKSFKVFRPELIEIIDRRWAEDERGAIGRWQVRVRDSGQRASDVHFIPFSQPADSAGIYWEPVWKRVQLASNRLAEWFAGDGGSVGQVYDEKSRTFEIVVKEYVLAWTALLEADHEPPPHLALVNTVEVQNLSGRTIGLIVLPSHPLRLAWHAAYDNLVLHARFEQQMRPVDICEELRVLDGALFPAFLPGLDAAGTFVFYDTLGFHAAGMVLDWEPEPKAAIAVLARALNPKDEGPAVPTVGKQSAEMLGAEVLKYLQCHDVSNLLLVHALRPGDGLTTVRALGRVNEALRRQYSGESEEEQDDGDGEAGARAPAFILELYPSEAQRGVAGRFIAQVCEKRRSGAGSVSAEDSWMMESVRLAHGVNLPRLRWARRDFPIPKRPAHLAMAFDTFDSRVVTGPEPANQLDRPLSAFGLLSYFDRRFSMQPSPVWQGRISLSLEGEKHPSDRSHTERLIKLQQAIQRLVVRHLGGTVREVPLLQTEITEEKAESLEALHALCDWVITVDRNAGIEYFDSPRDNRRIYDAYVIDCVPESEDLGTLQLVTSTSSLDEVWNILGTTLEEMGLSRSLRNAEFLLEQLKAFSGRLAIRLTGSKAASGELIALAMVYAQCRNAAPQEADWPVLSKGFFVPVDDVRDLLPSIQAKSSEEPKTTNVRPDLIYVSCGTRNRLMFSFVEVKYRRTLRTARDADELCHIHNQTMEFRKRWTDRYLNSDTPAAQRAVRRAKLACVLRFYAERAKRHYLDDGVYVQLVREIDRMIEKGASYTFYDRQVYDYGFVFCPECQSDHPIRLSPEDWTTRIYMFGPAFPPDPGDGVEPSRSMLAIPRRPGDGDAPQPEAPASLAGKIPTGRSPVPGTWSDAEAAPPGRCMESGSPDPRTSEKEGVIPADGAGCGAEHCPEFPPSPPDETALEPSGTLTVSDRDLKIYLGEAPRTNERIEWCPSTKGHPHLMVVGLSGMGKTTCLVNICHQLKEQGTIPIVFSYHQDIDDRLEKLFGTVRFVDYDGLGYNPLSIGTGMTKRSYLDVAGELRDIFQAIFPDLGDLQREAIRSAIKESFEELGWQSAYRASEERPIPPFRRFVEILKGDPSKGRERKNLLARLQELEDYGLFEEGPPLGSLWDSQDPVIIRIHSTQNDNLQRAFASLLFYGLYKEMFYRRPQDRLSHFILFDEAHRAARLKLIPTMAQECRKYGIGLILASQKTQDFHLELFSIIANYLVLRLTDQDARSLVRNVSASDIEKSLIDRIKQMEKYRAVFLCEGRKPSYIQLANPSE